MSSHLTQVPTIQKRVFLVSLFFHGTHVNAQLSESFRRIIVCLRLESAQKVPKTRTKKGKKNQYQWKLSDDMIIAGVKKYEKLPQQVPKKYKRQGSAKAFIQA